MRYTDRIYGKKEIKEEIIEEIMNTPVVQRLKSINQYGPVVLLNPKHPWRKLGVSRFEHSIGVYILLNEFGASLVEKCTGILHDISHTVFSHATDYLFKSQRTQDSHEKFYEKMILNSEIPQILSKYGIEVEAILNPKRYQILDKETPDICADRIDYTLRDAFVWGKIGGREIAGIISKIKVFGGELIFVDRRAAKLFANTYLEMTKHFWCTAYESTLYKLTSELLMDAISKRVINKTDLFSTDEIVYKKLRNSTCDGVKKLLRMIKNLKVVENKNDYDLHTESKVRVVDPKVLIKKIPKRLSELDSEFKKEYEKTIEDLKEGFFVKILSK